MDEKNDRYIVNGAHDAERLRDLLDGFIDKFVLCAECKNPETDLFLTKSEDIFRDCKACGARTGVDMRHKLTTYIVRNPPKKASKASKKKSTDAEGAGDGAASPEGGEANGEGSDDEFTKKIINEAGELPTAEQAAANGMAGLSIGDDEGSDEGGDSPLQQLTLWVEENRGDGTSLGVDAVKGKAEELGIEGKYKTVQALAECLFTDKVMTELPRYMPLFEEVCFALKTDRSMC